MSYPIQPGKVQAPALRDETLARTRLLDWLEIKIHSRVIFITADAGYGKTTLLADFSRRTRLRTMWYRLDEDDRDWVGFLSHLVAAGREHDADFAPRTAAMLRSLEPGGPTREDAVEAFLAELPSISAEGAALIFDDFHLADEVADVRMIAREIVTRAPERLSIVFASRRPPPVPVSKLRTLGEVAELGIADLRFSDAELEQLFRETYGRPLEPDVLTELARRTEGWAASLTLVQAALRERSAAETRSFVRGLSGARDELHDYLAEEVVGDLLQIHQRFLMQTSLLQVVTPELAQVASGLSAVEVQSLILESERLGLLGRRPSRRSTAQRYHPLVREFLEDRLRRAVGKAGVDALHVTIASWAESTDWRTAAYHYTAASRWAELQRVLDTHVETIVGSGAFSAAAEFIRRLPTGGTSAAVQVVLAREASVIGDFAAVSTHAQRAFEIAPTNDVVLGNLVASKFFAGSFEDAAALGRQWANSASSPLQRDIAQAFLSILEASLDGSVDEAIRRCESLAERAAEDGLHHVEGVSWLNAGLALLVAGRLSAAKACTARAIEALAISSSGVELGAAHSLDAAITALTGDLPLARRMFEVALESSHGDARVELISEYADIETLVGDSGRAGQLLAGRDDREINTSTVLVSLLEGLLLARAGQFDAAADLVMTIPLDKPSANTGFQSRLRATRALLLALSERHESKVEAQRAIRLADRQGAQLWRAVAELALGHAERSLNSAIRGMPDGLRSVLSLAAELVIPDMDSLDDEALAIVRASASRAPERWRPGLRHELLQGRPSRLAAARLLDEVGERKDVHILRKIAREPRRQGADRRLGRGLARRLAPRVEIQDLGRVAIAAGNLVIGGGEIRRKVLALLCFLLTRPRWAATREEVMDAMWPDIDPSSAVNSLNQSIYFLRRVFEAEYSEETTAGYLHQESDLVWLDRDLISASSATCSELIAEYGRSANPQVVEQLSEAYTGRFALDFAYDEWTADFREWLHVAYLQIVETQIRLDVDHGNYRRGISLARSALEIEPRNEELELSLLKLLRGAGAYSAAAEQYSRYANVLRNDLGVDPPSPDSV